MSKVVASSLQKWLGKVLGPGSKVVCLITSMVSAVVLRRALLHDDGLHVDDTLRRRRTAVVIATVVAATAAAARSEGTAEAAAHIVAVAREADRDAHGSK
ncbi:hypothetical protein DVH05_021090 [Phytophthora capsici]|nr:hypothetical protein DVH05_021090 [Phytophthora capsici]